MKKIIILFNILVAFHYYFWFHRNKEDDYTNYSKLTPTNPTVTVQGIENGSFTLTESDVKYPVTVTLSEAQIVDVTLNISQISGDATYGVDYSVPFKCYCYYQVVQLQVLILKSLMII
ncbi:MAG: hypothetical protein R2771_08440 [Saprospiraceae bacterium]